MTSVKVRIAVAARRWRWKRSYRKAWAEFSDGRPADWWKLDIWGPEWKIRPLCPVEPIVVLSVPPRVAAYMDCHLAHQKQLHRLPIPEPVEVEGTVEG